MRREHLLSSRAMAVDSQPDHPVSGAGEAHGRSGDTSVEKSSYGQILKSSALVGASSVATIGVGILRTKAMAILLGPAGFGLMGLFGAVSDLASTVAGLGVNSSGVRQISEAVGSGEHKRIARTVLVLRRVSVLLGVGGAVLLALLASPLSVLTFGSDAHAGGVALLSLAVFLRLVSAGQGALLQGMRRIRDMALSGVLGVLFGAVASIAFVYFWRENGVVPSLIATAAMSVLLSWWYARKVHIQPSPQKSRTRPLCSCGSAWPSLPAVC
jgi:O-antigen/teichoic acid export membrane protein